MKTAITILMTAAIATAAPCHIQWNRNPEPNITAYRIWRGIDMLGETTDITAAVDLPPDQASTITVTAHIGEKSSKPSIPLVVIPFVAQTSTDGINWIESSTAVRFAEATPARFFRVRYLVPDAPPVPPAPESSPLALEFQPGSLNPVPTPIPTPAPEPWPTSTQTEP